MIGIIDYGVGNLASVANAFERIGSDVMVCTDPAQLERCSHLVLPGVGSFRTGMEALHRRELAQGIVSHVKSRKPLLGICLGMQLLFERGSESGPSVGLGLIPGDVLKLSPTPPLKVPHVGWNSLSEILDHPLMVGVKPGVDVYFVHSYHCRPRDPSDVIANCDFGGTFVAAVARRNVAGMQFHPEKSQPAGVKILENFTEWVPEC
jgi:glutamine amidotransferase